MVLYIFKNKVYKNYNFFMTQLNIIRDFRGFQSTKKH